LPNKTIISAPTPAVRRATHYPNQVIAPTGQKAKIMNTNAQAPISHTAEPELGFDNDGRVRWHSVSSDQRELIVPEPRISAPVIRAFILASTELETGYDIGEMSDEEAWHYSVIDAAAVDAANLIWVDEEEIEFPGVGRALRDSETEMREYLLLHAQFDRIEDLVEEYMGLLEEARAIERAAFFAKFDSGGDWPGNILLPRKAVQSPDKSKAE